MTGGTARGTGGRAGGAKAVGGPAGDTGTAGGRDGERRGAAGSGGAYEQAGSGGAAEEAGRGRACEVPETHEACGPAGRGTAPETAGRGAGPAAGREWARHWRHEALPGLDLLRARYVDHTFPRHSHEGYLLAAVLRGTEDIRVPSGRFLIRPGSVAALDPEVPHAARSGDPGGWTYIALYPSLDLVAGIAGEISTLRGTPGFRDVITADPYAARLLRRVYEAADAGNALAADTLLRAAIARLLRSGGRLPERTPRPATALAAARARDLLTERMTAPPSLEELARETGTGPFALLRAFRAAYGMPPHTWLTDARVRRAQQLLARGERPAGVAATVGFTDQPHLNRHFTRIVGVTPGAYRRERTGTRGRTADRSAADS